MFVPFKVPDLEGATEATPARVWVGLVDVVKTFKWALVGAAKHKQLGFKQAIELFNDPTTPEDWQLVRELIGIMFSKHEEGYILKRSVGLGTKETLNVRLNRVGKYKVKLNIYSVGLGRH